MNVKEKIFNGVIQEIGKKKKDPTNRKRMVKPPQTSNPYNGKQSVYPKSIKESPDTTGYTVGGWWTPICVDLIEFNLL